MATLQAVPSNCIFQRRIVSLQQPASSTTLATQRKQVDNEVNRRRQCVSLDEGAIQSLHKPKATSQATSSALLSSTEQSPQRSLPQPVQPSFEPPERVKTPEGVPSWRGEVGTALANRSPTPPPPTSSLLRLLRARSSQALRTVFGISKHGSAQSRTWRPPVSGHTTQRYGELETHPFASAPVAELEGSSVVRGGDELNLQTQEHDQTAWPLTPHQLQGRNAVLDHSDWKDGNNGQQRIQRVLSPSQRALQAANGNAVLVTPRRARMQAEASNSYRSVSVPNGQLRSPHSTTAIDGRPQSIPNGTLRTIELIEQFPAPPASNHSANVGKRPLISSLFPRTNVEMQKDGRSETQHQSGIGKKLHMRSRSNAICKGHTAPSAAAGEQTVPSEVETLGSPSHTINEELTGTNGATPYDQPDRPSIRGESTSRYRHSGTPIYDNEATSLRSYDGRSERTVQQRLFSLDVPPPLRAASAQTGNSRYFSAASTSLGTRALSQSHLTLEHEREQERRAVANGALRFAGGQTGAINTENHTSPSAHIPPTSNDENAFPLTPVTFTRASKIYCRHRLKKLHLEQQRSEGANRADLDGTSPPPPSPMAVQPSDRNATGLTHLNTHPSAETFYHRHHLSHRINRGTWRTRMKKTKCWRCELEARRTASSEALYKQYRNLCTGWGVKWERCKERLKWTCFCRYRGYDTDDEDDESVVQERVRLGRLGGRLG